jgi:formylglycine-generating enzyme required for sulfatase activity
MNCARFVAFAAALAGCFPDYSGLTGGAADDASLHDAPVADEEAIETGIGGDSAPPPVDALEAESRVDANVDPCRADGGPGGIYISASADYCIDETEVTNGDYAKFLDARPDAGLLDQPTFCSWNTTFAPNDPMWPRLGEELFPISQVDWCDAWSYCKWAGKRLCGKIGPGDLADVFATDATRSQWFRACAGPSGSSAYPYGDTYDPTRCNGVDNVPPQAREVRTYTSCQGFVPGLFDMSGNVYEWIDVCDVATGPDDSCRTAGGAFNSPSYELACGYRAVIPRNSAIPNVGFRCCADL